MNIMIDNHKVIDVQVIMLEDEDGDVGAVLPFDDTYRLLEAWKELNIGHRNYRFGGGVDDNEPDTIIIAWANSSGLTMTDVDPFYGRNKSGFTDTLNAYALSDLIEALPLHTIEHEALG